MSQRFTKADAERAFLRLVEDAGARVANDYKDVGGWRLDYAACYGGYVVEKIMNERGGISHPLGGERRTAKEFWAFAHAFRYGTMFAKGEWV